MYARENSGRTYRVNKIFIEEQILEVNALICYTITGLNTVCFETIIHCNTF